MKAVKGIYENGTIRLLEDPRVSGLQQVYILFPEVEQPTISSVPASAFKLVDGIVSLGGHALEDAERLWEENLRVPDHS
jgi:hypothetical protein